MSMKPNLYDAVRLLEPVQGESLSVGAVGAIVAVFSEPEEAYEVEFVNSVGETVAQIALRPTQFAIISQVGGGQ